MMSPASIPWIQLVSHAVPILFLCALATVILVADLWWREHDRTPLLGAAVIGCLFAAGFDRLTWMGGIVVLIAAALTICAAGAYLRERRLPMGEFLALFLYGVAGIWLMIATTNLLMIFIGLETLSLSAYVLAAFHRAERRSVEAGIKYFLLGSVAAAFLLFGIAFLYGGTGTTDLQAMAQVIGGTQGAMERVYSVIGAALILVGLGFKIAAVPFQFWTPDVYEGAPLPVTAFFATGVKAGAFLVLWRAAEALTTLGGPAWTSVVTVLAVATMTVGNCAALMQEDVKRMLAYSSIAHAGYALIGVLVMGGAPLLFYLTAYTVMTMGAFAVVIALGTEAKERTAIFAFAGLGSDRPWLAAAMTLFLLSLAGVPPTVGFFAKYYLFQAA
ncbi:MAG: NADH-quinone oxidoreductase subunit N, partial [Deltaproteobacteria bacterium]|nr:NADH-quinone oxidoreductase subunit N [Deltaproteobacteria bacterium]